MYFVHREINYIIVYINADKNIKSSNFGDVHGNSIWGYTIMGISGVCDVRKEWNSPQIKHANIITETPFTDIFHERTFSIPFFFIFVMIMIVILF